MVSTILQIKMAIDVGMLLCWGITMAYKATGNAVHEVLGMFLFVLFFLHTILNWRWYAALPKGTYNKRRIISTVVNLLLLVCMLATIATVPVISRTVLTAFNSGLDRMARRPWQGIHKAASKLGFALVLVHLVLHASLLKNFFWPLKAAKK